MFVQMAKLPIIALPMGGVQSLQPVHIDDVCLAVERWLNEPNAVSQIVEAVGAEATTMRGMIDSYRAQLHLRPAWHVSVPSGLVRLAALAGDYIPSSPMCSDTFTMLTAGNIADMNSFRALLKQTPRSYREFIDQH
jgi:uncharacterized protein YbjT (DUF2867 family)